MLPYGYVLYREDTDQEVAWTDFVSGTYNTTFYTMINDERVEVSKRDRQIVLTWNIEGPINGSVSKKYQAQMADIEEKTKNNTGTVLNVAINYGGRQEILHAARALARQVQQGMLQPEEIDEARFSAQLYTAGQKDPDFILRPSGELRLSNFMLWQASYAEFISMDVLWPDFTRADLDKAIEEFNRRSRRFGGL